MRGGQLEIKFQLLLAIFMLFSIVVKWDGDDLVEEEETITNNRKNNLELLRKEDTESSNIVFH